MAIDRPYYLTIKLGLIPILNYPFTINEMTHWLLPWTFYRFIRIYINLAWLTNTNIVLYWYLKISDIDPYEQITTPNLQLVINRWTR